jgi:UDP-N-acetyl-D-mannosaminuronic acid transferase (WecB/TagA/CpsF family)
MAAPTQENWIRPHRTFQERAVAIAQGPLTEKTVMGSAKRS